MNVFTIHARNEPVWVPFPVAYLTLHVPLKTNNVLCTVWGSTGLDCLMLSFCCGCGEALAMLLKLSHLSCNFLFLLSGGPEMEFSSSSH